MQSGHVTLQNTEAVPEEFNDSDDHQALVFEFYNQSYGLWLDGDDVLTGANEKFENRYGNPSASSGDRDI
jgi:kinetochore protein NDC80